MISNIFKFAKGTDLSQHEATTGHCGIEVLPAPKQLVFPLNMHLGAPAVAAVEVGDHVKVGTQIAKAASAISAHVHASVSGEVVAIEERMTSKGLSQCIVIANDEHDEAEPWTPHDVEAMDAPAIIEAIRQAGIIGMGGAGFPCDIKLQPQAGAVIDTVIINGAECEPYSTADQRVMAEHADQLVLAIACLRRIFGNRRTFVAIERHAENAQAAMEKALRNHAGIDIRLLENIYPQGAEKVLIKTLANQEVPPGKLPADVGVFVANVSTCFAIYEALYLGKPSIDRITTVTGSPVSVPRNLRVRIGTPIQHLLQACGGLKETAGQLIHGGPMMGRSLMDDQVPITKTSSIILVQNEEEARKRFRSECIMCSRCLDVCPINLQPILISKAYEANDIALARDLGAMDCFECGNCTFICPAKIPLLDNIRAAKAAIRELS